MDEPKRPPTTVDPREPPDLQKIVSSLPVDHAGTTVYVKGWRRETECRHPIVIVHDLGEHTELYRDTALDLVAAGYSVYIFDLRGHGRSGRRLGHAPSFDILVKDLLQVAAWVRHKEKGRAPIVLGHGIGALIAIEFTKAHGNFCKAAILSAPSLELIHEVSFVARILIRVIAELSPTFRIPAQLSPRFAKDLKHEQRAADDQPAEAGPAGRVVYFPRLTAIFAQELLNAISRTVATFIEYHGSVLILCPENDAVCGYTSLKRSAAIHDEHNLRMVDLPNVGHGVFTDSEEARAAAMGVILPWLDGVLRAKPEIRLSGASRSAHPRPLEDAESALEKPGASKL